MVALEMATGPPLTIDTVFRLISDADVATSQSMTNVPPDVVYRAHDAVPVANAFDVVIALNVSNPDADAGAAVAESAKWASFVVAVPPDAGRTPL